MVQPSSRQPKRVPFQFVWDEAAVRFFWRSQPVPDQGFFSDTRVEMFARLVRRFAPAGGGRILEIGVGSGALLLRLAQRGWRPYGADVAWELVASISKRGIRGVVAGASGLPFSAGSFDAVVMLEVLEHLLPGHAEAGVAEAARLLRPHGLLLLSTPHDERLQDHQVVCPNCAALFHPVQHLRSFTAPSLRALVEARGFATRLCLPVKLRETVFPVEWSLRLGAWWRNRRGKVAPSLLYVGERR